MKHLVLILSLTLLAGLGTVGQALGAEEQMGTSSAMSGETQQQQTAAMQLNQEQIREMQTLLNQKGFHSGTPDGVMGQLTMDALRQFQLSEGLTATGTPNRETLRALAPSSEKQEFFGLSPAYGEKEQHQMQQRQMEQHRQMEQQQMQHQQMQQKQMPPKGSGS